MAQGYDVQAIMNLLRGKSEMNPDEHDGCYELMRETIEAYSKLKDFSVLDYKDLNLVYLTTVGTWRQGIEAKKNTIKESHLLSDDKEHLILLIDEIWEKASRGEYTSNQTGVDADISIGLFGTGFFSFENKTTPKHVQDFIRMCCDLLPMTDDLEMYDRAAIVLTKSFQGMRAASASMVLHCLHPKTFPVMNANMGNKNIFEVLGVKLYKRDNIETYIVNCRRIKVFRDRSFIYKNYRIFDIAAWQIEDYAKEHEHGVFGAWEVVSETVARVEYDESLIRDHCVDIPKEILWFFRLSGISKGAMQSVVLMYQGAAYDGYIRRDFENALQIRLNWYKVLADEFEDTIQDDTEHYIVFKRVEDFKYEISVIELPKEASSKSGRVWLISWNKNNWNWPIFDQKCQATKIGRTVLESWACASSKPQIGDEVFLIKLGDQPRGIIGHGTVERAIYEKEHYNVAKAAEGKKEKAIDVRFDRLIDYSKERFIPQDELNEKCVGQQWSPQSSGIEIKPAVLPELKKLWEAVTANFMNVEEWWPSLSEYDPGITAEEYKELFTTESIVKRAWLEALYELYKMPGSTASCKQLGVQYGYSPAHYISYFSSAAQNIQKEIGVGSPEDDKDAKCWPVLFQGKYLKDKNKGSYCYKMREPVKEAIEMLMKEGAFDAKGKEVMIQFDHNLILYGPPGTGKTYHSVIYAVAICDGKNIEEVSVKPYRETLGRYKELKEEGRIAFTTFHQSYGYEEFIEGIKPKLDTESDSIGYTIEDGVFKKFCKRAKAIKVQMTGKELMKTHPRIWGMILGGTGQTELKRECFEKGEIRLGWSEVSDEDVEGDFYGDTNASWQAKHMVSDFKNSMEIGDIVVIEKSNSSIDAIGVITGEYSYNQSYGRYPRSRKVEWLVKDIDEDMLPYLPNGRKQLSRFSLFAFDYIGMDVISQILNENTIAPILEIEQETKPYVFIIDEINRGNISKIFGELITLIEDTKRAGASEAMEAILPYSGEAFSVPNNVFILGTMNTADRSIALMDTALRRRFEFKEMMPDSKILDSLDVGTIAVDGEQLNVARMLDIINKRIEYLFDREHTIGHAFFTKLVDDPSLETLASIFEKNVIPLLQEYFYEDYEKIQLVLGDDSKADEFKFILDRTVKAENIFNSNPDIDLPDKGYSVQHEAFRRLESYKQIAKGL